MPDLWQAFLPSPNVLWRSVFCFLKRFKSHVLCLVKAHTVFSPDHCLKRGKYANSCYHWMDSQEAEFLAEFLAHPQRSQNSLRSEAGCEAERDRELQRCPSPASEGRCEGGF